MQLDVPVFRITSPTQVTVSASRKTLVTEHSDMGNMPLLSQLYDDACDVGFASLNSQTGVLIRWHLKEERKDAEGELAVTIFGPCSESVHKVPALEGWTFHVLND